MRKKVLSYIFIAALCLCALLSCLGLAGAVTIDLGWYQNFTNFIPVIKSASIVRDGNGTDVLTIKAYMGEYGTSDPEYEAFVFDENEMKIDIATIPSGNVAFDSSTNVTTIKTQLYYMGISDPSQKPAAGSTVNVSMEGVFWINGSAYCSKLAGLYKLKIKNDGETSAYDLANAKIVLANTTAVYTGSAIKPAETVTVGGVQLVKGTDYTMSYVNNTHAGTGTAIATGTGGNTGSINATFVINPRDISTAEITLANTSAVYTGSAIKPAETVTVGGVQLVKGTDYTMSYKNNTNAGTGTAIATGKGDNTGSVNATFVINPRDISTAEITLANTSAVYTGSPIEPEETVMVDGAKLKRGVDYTVSYQNNTEVGTATAKATGKGNYTGTLKKDFEITAKDATDLSEATVTLQKTKYTYNGKAKKPGVTVVWNGETLQKGTDYTVSYANNKDAGKGTATVTGKGRFKGSVTREFKINKAGNSIKISPTKKTLEYTKLEKETQSFKLKAKVKGKAKVTFKMKSASGEAKKYIKVSSSGKVTVKKGIPKGTYKIKVTATAKSTKNFKKKTATKTITIKVK